MAYYTIIILIISGLVFRTSPSLAQVSISDDDSPPGASAGLDLNFSDKGFLPPRMSYDERNAIADPAEGLIVFCTNCGLDSTGLICIFTNGEWKTISPCVTDAPVAGIPIPLDCAVTWTWNPVPGATGYKWNTVNSYDGAVDIGVDTSWTETGLQCGTSAYSRYVWTYSDCGISAPETLMLVYDCPPCGQPFMDCRDGKFYNTVLIGTQCWMAQNLNVGTRINASVNQTNNGSIEKYCYNNLESNCDIYGGMYHWTEFMNYTVSSNSNPSGRQGICPAGYHVPSDAEWCQLELYLDATVVCEATELRGTDAGGQMKEAGTAHWASPNTGATNSSGFTALPGGGAYLGGFNELTLKGHFWTSTAYMSGFQSFKRYLDYWYAKVGRSIEMQGRGISGRCVKD